ASTNTTNSSASCSAASSSSRSFASRSSDELSTPARSVTYPEDRPTGGVADAAAPAQPTANTATILPTTTGQRVRTVPPPRRRQAPMGLSLFTSLGATIAIAGKHLVSRLAREADTYPGRHGRQVRLRCARARLAGARGEAGSTGRRGEGSRRRGRRGRLL